MPERTVYDELADRLRGMVTTRVRQESPPVTRGRVKGADPLVVELDDDTVIEEGDPDVEVDKRLLGDDRPAKDDVVRVHHDGDVYVIAGVVE